MLAIIFTSQETRFKFFKFNFLEVFKQKQNRAHSRQDIRAVVFSPAPVSQPKPRSFFAIQSKQLSKQRHKSPLSVSKKAVRGEELVFFFA